MQRRLRLEGQLSKLQRVPEEPPATENPIGLLLDLHTRPGTARHHRGAVSH
jgi:hypothetical protein